jgi:hypothetical protein
MLTRGKVLQRRRLRDPDLDRCELPFVRAGRRQCALLAIRIPTAATASATVKTCTACEAAARNPLAPGIRTLGHETRLIAALETRGVGITGETENKRTKSQHEPDSHMCRPSFTQ